MNGPIVIDPEHGPKSPIPLADFRRYLRDEQDRNPLGQDGRELILRQAQTMIDQIYVHRTLKQTLYGIDAAQQLRQLAGRMPTLDDLGFHEELLRIFDELRDMHTTYVLPEPHRGRVLLGFTVERCWQASDPTQPLRRDKQVFLVTMRDPERCPQVPLHAEIVSWNGLPVGRAVDENAESEAGGNAAARFARGLETLTNRNAAVSPLPDEDAVRITFVDPANGKRRTVTVPWLVDHDPDGPDFDDEHADVPAGLGAAAVRGLGFSRRTELGRRVRYHMRDENPPPYEMEEIPTEIRGALTARRVKIGDRWYGHLRLHTFRPPTGGVAELLAEYERVLPLLPQTGLILDVRGNGGGFIDAAEGLLELLTDREIRREPMQFTVSPLVYQVCGQALDLLPWRPSLREAGQTGAQYSAALPISRPVRRERHYHGKLILVTDALSYSATDILAAGFQDNRLGPVLGVDESTGAGGANVWSLRVLRQTWAAGPFRRLPRGALLTVAVRRSLRVGRQLGRPVEDFGVVPDVRYRMTRNDLLHRNTDLLAWAVRQW